MVEDLKAGFISGILLDYPTVSALQRLNCDTALVEFSGLLLRDRTTAFPQNSWDNRKLIEAYNAAIRRIEELGIVEQYITQYMGGSSCTSEENSSQVQVTWGEVSGLWIVLGSSIGLAVICVSLSIVLRHYKPDLQKRAWYKKLTRVAETLNMSAIRRRPDLVPSEHHDDENQPDDPGSISYSRTSRKPS